MEFKTHFCGRMPRMAGLTYKKNRGMHGEGYVLNLSRRVKEGKLQPKTISIDCDINFCPFCGIELIKLEEHKGDCKCSRCEMERELTGR